MKLWRTGPRSRGVIRVDYDTRADASSPREKLLGTITRCDTCGLRHSGRSLSSLRGENFSGTKERSRVFASFDLRYILPICAGIALSCENSSLIE